MSLVVGPGNRLGEVVPFDLLLGAEIRAVEQLLQANNLGAFVGGLVDQCDVLVDHRPLDLFDRRGGRLAQAWLESNRRGQSGMAVHLSIRCISPQRHGGHGEEKHDGMRPVCTPAGNW